MTLGLETERTKGETLNLTFKLRAVVFSENAGELVFREGVCCVSCGRIRDKVSVVAGFEKGWVAAVPGIYVCTKDMFNLSNDV